MTPGCVWRPFFDHMHKELLDRAEDARDTAWLTKAREKPRHYRSLEEYLAERNAKRA